MSHAPLFKKNWKKTFLLFFFRLVTFLYLYLDYILVTHSILKEKEYFKDRFLEQLHSFFLVLA